MADLPRLVDDDYGIVEVAEQVHVARLETERELGTGSGLPVFGSVIGGALPAV